MKKFISILFLLFFSTTTFCMDLEDVTTDPTPGQFEMPPFEVLGPTINGTGCKMDTASLLLLQDGKTISLTTSDYKAVVSTRPFDRKNCAMVIPLKIQEGYQVAVDTITTKVEGELPEGATLKMQFEVFFKDSDIITRDFAGPLTISESIILFDEFNGEETTAWSGCGSEEFLRINSSLLLKSNKPASFGLSSSDEEHFIKLKWRVCDVK